MRLSKITKPPVLFAILVAAWTAILFPIKEEAMIINMASGNLVASPDVVSLGPVYNISDRDADTSIRLSPNLEKYAKTSPREENLALLVNRKRDPSGKKTTNWSFASGVWLLVVVLPSMVLTGATSLLLRKKTSHAITNGHA